MAKIEFQDTKVYFIKKIRNMVLKT